MELNFKAMQEAADRHAAESEQAFIDRMREERKKREERQAEYSRLMIKAAERKRKANANGSKDEL